MKADKLSGVPETMLITLWAKATETNRPDALLRDPKAVEIMNRIDYDFTKFRGGTMSQVGCCIRADLIDREAKKFLEAHPDAVVFPISEQPLKKALAEAGIAMSEDPESIDIVIASYDRTFEYRKLQIAFDAIWFHKRAFLITTNPDRYCPFPGGRGEPDAASIVAAIEACTGATCQANMGKPEATMLSAAIDGLDVDPADCMMVGDRLMTDIGMAIKTGMASCLLLTGDSTLEEAEALDPADQPTYVLDRIDHLIPESTRLQWGWSDGDS